MPCYSLPMNTRDIFMAKVRRGEAPRAGIGTATSIVTTDLMEAAGASFPEAHLEPEAMFRLALAGHAILGFDNVMPLFSVWHESAALGCTVDWGHSRLMPDGHALCSSIDDAFAVPPDFLDAPSCTVPLRALERLKRELGGDAAVIGKVFGPWTLAYHVFGVQEFLMATLLNPGRVRQILRQLTEVTVRFARAQIDHGADALCLADHCTRDLCSPAAYRDFLAGIHRELHERIPCPLILHICGDTADRLEAIRGTGIDCFHFDAKVPADRARELAGGTLALMGGTSNIAIVRNGTPEAIERDVADKLRAGIDIVGPECAVPLDAPYRNLRLLADCARKRM